MTSRRSGNVRRAAVCSVFVMCVMSMSFFGTWTARMDSSLGNVAVGTGPNGVAVNPVTNKIYVANQGGNTVTVIDGTNNSTTPVTVGTNPIAVAVNPVTNKIYVANCGTACGGSSSSNDVTVIDGTNNTVAATVAAGTNPVAVAVNPVTNKIYVANNGSANVTVIDGTNNSTQTVAAGTLPRAIAVNPVTNKIYVTNVNSNDVTVIDGTNNSTTPVTVGTQPDGVAINPVTNKIYVANNGSANVTVIDGTNNSTATVAAGTNPVAIAVNPVTNKIYVANNGSSNVTVIDGTNNSTTPVTAGTRPRGVAVNPVTNKIYVANQTSNDVTVIDGTTNSTTPIMVGTTPQAVAVNPVTNKIYVANTGSSNNVTVIDGTNNSTQTVAAGTSPNAVAVNPITNKIYVANGGSANVTVITPAPTNAIPLNTTVTPAANNTVNTSTPTFTLTATSTYAPTAPQPQTIYFQVDTLINTSLKAVEQSRTATTVTANATTPALQPGIHILYFFASDGSDATSINPIAHPGDFNESGTTGGNHIESSPVIGGINAYLFLVVPAPTAANSQIGGTITTADDGTPLAGITVRLAGTNTALAITDAAGRYNFENLNPNGFYTVTPARRDLSFTPQARSFALTGNRAEGLFTAASNPVTPVNPLDDAGYFVRQQYIDFLSREPDQAGFAFWTNEINKCGGNQACIETQRINVSAAYFLSTEFQQTGYEVYRAELAAFGAQPRYANFISDSQHIGQGVVVNQTGWQAKLETNTASYFDELVSRAEFLAKYPNGMTGQEFVSTLNANTHNALSAAELTELAAGLDNHTLTRAAALRRMADNTRFIKAEFTRAFVLVQYFGYLRRNPDDAPDGNLNGYNFWLDKLNLFGGDYNKAEMVRSFIVSREYRTRFGQP